MVRRSKSSSVDETCRKFLRAAEKVYIKSGYNGTTIRAITLAAEVNLGTLHHYWGTKEALFKDLFEERFRPLCEAHVALMSGLKAQVDAGEPVQLREIVRALIEPVLLIEPSSGSNSTFHRLYGRVLSDPAPEIVKVMNAIFQEPIKLFIELVKGACPDLAVTEFRIRLNCLMGALVFQEAFEDRIASFVDSGESADNQRAQYMIDFLTAGLALPAAKLNSHR